MDFLGTPALAIVAVYLYIELQEWYEKNIEKPRWMAKLKRSLSATKSEQGINTTEKLPIVRTFEEPSAPNREELLEEKIEKLNR